jgi:hypothetical protein
MCWRFSFQEQWKITNLQVWFLTWWGGGLSILKYVDDIVVFMDHSLEHARNVKLLLIAFEQMSCLKINFHKSEFFYIV